MDIYTTANEVIFYFSSFRSLSAEYVSAHLTNNITYFSGRREQKHFLTAETQTKTAPKTKQQHQQQL